MIFNKMPYIKVAIALFLQFLIMERSGFEWRRMALTFSFGWIYGDGIRQIEESRFKKFFILITFIIIVAMGFFVPKIH